MENKGTILYAEDEPSMRNLMRNIFESYFPNHVIEVFEDGSSLENRLTNGVENVSLVLTDNQIPGITGSEIIRKYSQTDAFKKIPFIIFTSEKDVGERSKEEGAFDYLPKPVSLGGINSAIRRALSNSES